MIVLYGKFLNEIQNYLFYNSHLFKKNNINKIFRHIIFFLKLIFFVKKTELLIFNKSKTPNIKACYFHIFI